MKTLREKVAEVKELLKNIELPKERIQEITNIIRREYPIVLKARKAYDEGFPEHEGPVWFDRANWKTTFWVRQWRLWRAYREGENARAQFQNKEFNPYLSHSQPTSKLDKLELATAWNLGFKGEEF